MFAYCERESKYTGWANTIYVTWKNARKEQSNCSLLVISTSQLRVRTNSYYCSTKIQNHLFGFWEITAQCDVLYNTLYKYSYLLTYLLMLCNVKYPRAQCPSLHLNLQHPGCSSLQSLHAEMHFTPFFMQLHHRVLQSPVQLQLVNQSNSSGATGSSVGIGSYPWTPTIHP